MNPSREEALFALALEKPTAERAAFLDRECSGAAQLRQRVENLLQAHERAGQFVNEPPAAVSAKSSVTTTASTPTTEKACDRIRRYQPLQHLSQGGYAA